MRDKELDIFRGLSMIYIVGIIHSFYWLNLFDLKLKSIILFEMPIIFFIMGASFSLNPKKLSLDYTFKRLFRCFLPFLFYNFFVLILNIIKNPCLLKENYLFLFKFLLDPLSRNNEIMFLNWHLWFMKIYIIFIPIIPLMYFYIWKSKCKYFYKILFPAILAFILFFLDFLLWNNIELKGNYYLRNILAYGIYIYLGFFYKKDINNSKNFYSILIGIFFIVILKNHYTFDMQINKFPPNFIFLVYTFVCFNFLLLINNLILKIYNNKFLQKIIKFYAEKNFILYLWHPTIYLIIFYFTKKLNITISNLFEKIIVIIIIIILNMINGLLFNWTEKINFKKFIFN